MGRAKKEPICGANCSKYLFGGSPSKASLNQTEQWHVTQITDVISYRLPADDVSNIVLTKTVVCAAVQLSRG